MNYIRFGFKMFSLRHVDTAARVEPERGTEVHGYIGAPSHLTRSAPLEPVNQASPAAEAPVAVDEDAQARCDAIQQDFRKTGEKRPLRRDPPPKPPALVPTDDALKLRLAEELEYVRRMLDGMGDSLSADAAVLVRHGVALQTVDIAGQILGHIAYVVRSSDPRGAVERIGMCELQGRLKRLGGV